MRLLSLLVGLSMVAGGCGVQSDPHAALKQPGRPLSLRPGTVAEDALAGGGRHVYRLDLPRGQYAELSIEQQGVDVMVRLEDTVGRPLFEVDSPNHRQGPEPLFLLGETQQPLRLIVMATDPQAAPGRYAIRASALREATGKDRAKVRAERIFARGEELRRKGEGEALQQAVTEHLRALAELRALADRRREADTLDRLGRIYLKLGDAGKAREAYLPATTLLRGLGARQELLAALNGLGQASRILGRPAESLASYREALEIQARLGDERASGITWNNIGRLQAQQGEFEEAFRSYDQALAVWRKLRDQGEEGITLGNIGRLYASLGETERAHRALEEAAALLEADGRLTDAATALADLGLLQANPQEGLATLRRALLLQERTSDRNGEAAVLNAIGWIHLQAGTIDEARQFFQRALTLYDELGGRPHQGMVLANLGHVAARQGRPRAALGFYDRALAILEQAEDWPHEASVLFSRALVYRKLGRLDEARHNAEEALSRIETLRGKPGSGELRASFLASRQEMHELLIEILLDLHRLQPAAGYAAAALGSSERARARSLLDALAEHAAGPGSDPDPALLAREMEVGRQLAAAERDRRRLAETGGPAARQAEARSRVDDLLRERERLEAEIRRTVQGMAPERILTSQEIQREVVAPGTLLLEYSLGKARSFLFAVAPDRLDIFELAPRARLEQAARNAHALLSAADRTPGRPRVEAALAELSQLLLAPVADRLAGQRLLVVPDGALSYVPFAALPCPGSGMPLVAEHEIAALPSASTLPALRRRGPAPAGLVAVVADPIVEPRLPFSREEAAAIQRLAPAGRRFEALGSAASRTTVLSGVLANYRIVHFATHGVIDSEHPSLSGLALSAVDAEGRQQESFLRAYEVRRMHLPADLVVLSACRTALGKEVRGEGLMGLTQSFFQAGTRRVVVSLWPVDDRATAKLMGRFYHHLLTEGRSPAAALRAAQISLSRTAPFQSPTSWAGFVLQGDF